MSVSHETWWGVGDVVVAVADTDPVTETDSCDSEFENYHNNDCCEYYCCCYSYFDGHQGMIHLMRKQPFPHSLP